MVDKNIIAKKTKKDVDGVSQVKVVKKIAKKRKSAAEEDKSSIIDSINLKSEAVDKDDDQQKTILSLKVLKYTEATGRRKTAIARVRLYTKKEGLNGLAIINDKFYTVYFPSIFLQKIVESPLEKMKSLDRFMVTAKVKGGGLHAQAEAVRHGIAQALAKFNPDFKKRLRRAGFITRDSRMVERKKFGLRKARRAPQWSKR